MTTSDILIIGAGMCGVASAIAIAKALAASNSTGHGPLAPGITIYELRDKPGTIGGAVNLSPSAVKSLGILGVFDEINSQNLGCETRKILLYSLHTAASMGMLDYRGKSGTGIGGYLGLRIMRGDLLKAMLAVAETLPNVNIVYGKKLTGIIETDEKVTAEFADGTCAVGAMVLGCDGIHSAVRSKFLDPGRLPEYSGIASAYSFYMGEDGKGISSDLKSKIQFYFEDASLAMARRGGILTAFCDRTRHRLYVAALMGSEKQIDKDGWRALGRDNEAVKADVMERFEESELSYMKEIVRGTGDWFLFPVYLLRPEGRWFTNRVLLLGDAAHAMPPKGESISHALLDTLVFSKTLVTALSEPDLSPPVTSSALSPSIIQATFESYTSYRKPQMLRAHAAASFGWNTNKDKGWLLTKIMEWITPLYLWWMKDKEEHEVAEIEKFDFRGQKD